MILKKTKGNYPVWVIAAVSALAGLFLCVEKYPDFAGFELLPLVGITCGIAAVVAALTTLCYFVSMPIVKHVQLPNIAKILMEIGSVTIAFAVWGFFLFRFYGTGLTLQNANLFEGEAWKSLPVLGTELLQEGILFLFGNRDSVVKALLLSLTLISLVLLYIVLRLWISRAVAMISTALVMAYMLIYGVQPEDVRFFIAMLEACIPLFFLAGSFYSKHICSPMAIIAGILAGLTVLHSPYTFIFLAIVFLFYMLQERKSNWVPLWFLLGLVLGAAIETVIQLFLLHNPMDVLLANVGTVMTFSLSLERLLAIFSGNIVWIVILGCALFMIPGFFIQGKKDRVLLPMVLWIWSLIYCFLWGVPESYEPSVMLVAVILAASGLCSCLYQAKMETEKETEQGKEDAEGTVEAVAPIQNAAEEVPGLMDGLVMVLPKRKSRGALEFPLEDVKMEYDYEVPDDADYDY